MPRPDEPKGNRARVIFGAGLNTAADETDIDPSECADGQNFDLSLGNGIFSRRKPFDLVDTAPNGEAVRGFAQLNKVDGTISTLVQAGGNVYEWDGDGTFTLVGTVNSGARLRGTLDSNWPLDDEVIITDLNEGQPVMKWDGTTFAPLAHGLGGSFFARYCFVENERAFYANVKSGSATPHMIVGSKRGDFENLSVSDRPASGLSDEDPFFLLAPDFKAINGIVSAFEQITFTTQRGRLYILTGSSAKVSTTTDAYAIKSFYANSGASGQEPMVFIGNDIAYGRPGKLETVFNAIRSGDIANDDLSQQIRDLTENIDEWTVVYNARLQKVYFFAVKTSELLVMHKSFLDERLRAAGTATPIPRVSPWSRWRTDHDIAFQPAAVMTMRRPTDGLETVYMGGQSGEIFALEGAGAQDGGTEDIKAERLSGVFGAPTGGPTFDIAGRIIYRQAPSAMNVTLKFEFGGESLFDDSITVALTPAANFPVWSGDFYWGSDIYYGVPFEKRLTLNKFSAAGRSEQWQVRATVDGGVDFAIKEIQIEFGSV